MSRYLMLVAVMLAGAGIPVQIAANRRMEEAVQSPPWSVAISFFVGGLAMAALGLCGAMGRGQLSGAPSAPWWSWSAGLLSAAVVIASVLALPRAGAGAVIAATLFGQLAAAAVLDHFGWLGVPQLRLNGWRVGGLVLLLGGALLMQHE